MQRIFLVGIVICALVGRVLAQAPAQTPKRIRVGGKVMQEKLIHQVAPTYPREAKRAGIQGTVRLDVVVGHDGRVLSTDLISGNETLARAAMKAVSKWRYKPVLLNGVPVVVVTEVDVNFNLAAN